MRWLALLLVVLPVRGLVQVRKPRPATKPPHFEFYQASSSSCPNACYCADGEKKNGGVATIHGLCHQTCSEKMEGERYCGSGPDYLTGDAIDCTACALPENFGAGYRLYSPPKNPSGSIIFLGPWNASSGWAWSWFIEGSEKLDPHFRQNYRLLDVVGRYMDGVHHAWFGYQDWFGEEPKHNELDLAVAYVHELLEQEYKIIGDYKKIVLAGLSQGANMALESAIRFPHPLGLVFSERGALLPYRRADPTVALHSKAILTTSYVLTMGSSDNYYPKDLVMKCCQSMLNANVPVTIKIMGGLDHYRWSYREWDLAIKAFGAAMNGDGMDTLAEWTNCYYA